MNIIRQFEKTVISLKPENELVLLSFISIENYL